MEQYTQDQIEILITQGIASIYGGKFTPTNYGSNLFHFSVPEEGIDINIYGRNVNSTARQRHGEIRGQFGYSDRISGPLIKLSVEQQIPTIPLFAMKDRGQFVAEDPDKFTVRIPDLLENKRTVSLAYTYVDVADQCQKSGVAVRRYATKIPQLAVHFQNEYLGWYLNNWKKIHNPDLAKSSDEELTFAFSVEAKSFLKQHPISSTDGSKPVADGENISKYGGGRGESEQHKTLKYIAAHSQEAFGLKRDAIGHIEYGEARFITGDHVDVLFTGGGRIATAIEVEVDREDRLLIGVHQAVKYRGLAAARGNYPGPFDFNSDCWQLYSVNFTGDYERC